MAARKEVGHELADRFRLVARRAIKKLRLLSLGILVLAGSGPAYAAEPTAGIAVFAFELDDRSAGRGIIEPDAADVEYLKAAADEARRMLAASGRYHVIDINNSQNVVAASGGFQNCNSCEAPLAQKAGADHALTGLVTRVTRTEYTLQILIRDTSTGEVLSNAFTGLRMGANYSWPRGVKWLMTNKILADDKK